MTFRSEFDEEKILNTLHELELELRKVEKDPELPVFDGVSLQQIAKHASCSKNTAKKYIQTLTKSGHVSEEKVPWIHNFGFTFRYKSQIVYIVTWDLIAGTIAQTPDKNVAKKIVNQLKKLFGNHYDTNGIIISVGAANYSKIYNSIDDWDHYFETELKPGTSAIASFFHSNGDENNV